MTIMNICYKLVFLASKLDNGRNMMKRNESTLYDVMLLTLVLT